MAKKTSVYAKALVESLDRVTQQEAKARIARFKKLLKKRGDVRMLSGVLQEFFKLWEQRKGKIANVVFASKPSLSFLDAMQKTVQQQGYQIKEQVDARVIGGVAVFLGNEYLFDNTLKGKLQRLYEVERRALHV
jgi:F0F1-type ATP synthase delta subunit